MRAWVWCICGVVVTSVDLSTGTRPNFGGKNFLVQRQATGGNEMEDCAGAHRWWEQNTFSDSCLCAVQDRTHNSTEHKIVYDCSTSTGFGDGVGAALLDVHFAPLHPHSDKIWADSIGPHR